MLRTTGSAATLSVMAALALSLAPAVGVTPAAAQDPFGGKFDHYECYTVIKAANQLATKVTLADQFSKDTAMTVTAHFLCNPVDKNGEGIPAKEVHLVCYDIVVANPSKQPFHVVTVNQLEKNELYVNGPQMLCVPSTKELIK